MYQPYLAKLGNKQIRFYSLPYNTVFLRIVWDFAPINQRNMTLKYFPSGLNLKPLNVPNPKLDNFFYSFSKKRKPEIRATTHRKTGFVLILAIYLSNGGSRLFYATNIAVLFHSNNFTGLNASVTLRKLPSLSFGTMETTG